MILQTQDNINEFDADAKYAAAPEDIGWFGSIATKYHQNSLTNLSLDRSEKDGYLDTIQGLLPDESFDSLGTKSFTKANIKLLDDQWDKGYYTFNEHGSTTATSEYDDAPGGINAKKFMASDKVVGLWLKLKAQGYTPDKIDKMVEDKTRGKWIEDEKTLRWYDKDNNYGSSGSSEFLADMAVWGQDPINLMGLGTEIGAFGALGKTLLKEGRSWKNVDEFLEIIGKEIKNWKIPDNVPGMPSTTEAISKMRNIRKFNWFKKIGKGEEYETMDELNKFVIDLKKNFPNITSKEVVEMVKKGGDFFKSPRTKELIAEAMRKDMLQEVFSVAGISGAIGGITEGVQSGEIFDYKTRILNGEQVPSYTEADRNKDIVMSSVFGFAGGAAFNLLGNMLRKVDPAMAGGEVIAEGAENSLTAQKAVSDIEDNIPVNGIDETVDDTVTPNFEKEGDDAITGIEDPNSFDILDADTKKEVIETKADSDMWNKIQNCMIENQIN